jgi:putative Mg2+ transporter-C (MgtC) family protein
MTADAIVISERLLAALVAGGLIGLERSYHGRAAGFRTHALVCVASSALMLVPVYQEEWFPATAVRATIDPTRMAQGIMTGIGFLGAGVIFKEGLSVRGLTTAASIWITSVIGILAGIGFYVPLVATTVVTVGVLSVFRWVEARIPLQSYAQLEIGFSADASMAEGDLRRLVGAHGFHPASLNYSYRAATRTVDYAVVMWTLDYDNLSRLAEALTAEPKVREFRLLPMGD